MNDNEARRESILTKLTQGSIILSLIAGLILVADKIQYQDNYQGLPLLFVLIPILIFLSVLILNRYHHSRLAGIIFVSTYFLINTGFLIAWGSGLPIGIIFYALIILVAGILFGNVWGLVSVVLSGGVIILLSTLEAEGIIQPNLYWQNEKISPLDKIPEIIILGIMMTINYFYNRQIEKSFQKAKKLEMELKAERDSLEAKVEERTKEIKEIQIEKMANLYRFAEFGRLSSGIFHDLMNPLSALTLNLGQARKDGLERSDCLDGAIRASRKMEDFIIALRKQLKRQSDQSYFSLNEEISQIIKILNHKIIKNDLHLKFSSESEIKSYGDPIKFNQIVINLISNAIDAYNTNHSKHRTINISLYHQRSYIYLAVSDRAGGITPDNLSKIFEPFFSTKSGPQEGLGIGLSSTKSIIEKDFDGSIKVKNDFGIGVKFIVKIPHRYDRLKQKTSRSHNQKAKAGLWLSGK